MWGSLWSSILRMAMIVRPVESHGDHEGDETVRVPEVRVPDLLFDEHGWLVGPGIEHIPTKRTNALSPLIRYNHDHLSRLPDHGFRPFVQGIVWHWTATRGAGRRLALNIAPSPKKGERAASWHLLIPAEGPMFQSAPGTVGTWHAGAPTAHSFACQPDSTSWRMTDYQNSERAKAHESANELYFGIELENVGEVRQSTKLWSTFRKKWLPGDMKWRGWPFGGKEADADSPKGSGPGPVVPDAETIKIGTRTYHAFTPHQEAQAERVVRAFLQRDAAYSRYDLSLTHAKIDPTRKSDPEPSWLPHLTAILQRANV